MQILKIYIYMTFIFVVICILEVAEMLWIMDGSGWGINNEKSALRNKLRV